MSFVNKKLLKIYELDTNEDIINRIASMLKTKVKYLYFNDYIPRIDNVRGKNIEVEEILTQISNEEIVEAKANLPAMYEKYAAMESGIIGKGRGDAMGNNKFDKLKIEIEKVEKIANITSDAERNDLSQQEAAGPYEGAFVAKTPDQMLKINQLVAERAAKELMIEMKADNAKENKFTTFTSQDQRTSTQINQANYVGGMSARNDMWLHNDQLRAALNYN